MVKVKVHKITQPLEKTATKSLQSVLRNHAYDRLHFHIGTKELCDITEELARRQQKTGIQCAQGTSCTGDGSVCTWSFPEHTEPSPVLHARRAYHTAKRYIAWEAHIAPNGYIANPAVPIPIMPEIATPVCALVRNDNGDGIYIAANKKLPSEEGSFIVSN